MPGDYQTIALRTEPPIARLTLSKPEKLNALDAPMLDELLDALAVVAADDAVSTLVVTGAGRAFSAGVDVESPFFFQRGDSASAYAATRSLNRQHRVIETLYELPQLTLAGVNGDAVGGAGFGIAMACDMRVAVRTARFWMVPGMLDVIQDFGLSWLVQRQIGSARTLRMAVLGEALTAETGARWGLVDTVVEDQDELAEHLAGLEQYLAGIGTDALRMLKLVVRTGAQTTLHDQLALEAVANGLNSHADGFGIKRDAFIEDLRARRAHR